MTAKLQIPAGYVPRDEAAKIVGMSGTTFDRLAPKVFPNCRIMIKNVFFYPISQLEGYRDYRQRCIEDGIPPLTWAEITQTEPAILTERMNILKWVLSPAFTANVQTKCSAAYIQQHYPGDYDRAKRVLNEIGLDLEEIRRRLTFLDYPPFLGEEPYHHGDTDGNTPF